MNDFRDLKKKISFNNNWPQNLGLKFVFEDQQGNAPNHVDVDVARINHGNNDAVELPAISGVFDEDEVNIFHEIEMLEMEAATKVQDSTRCQMIFFNHSKNLSFLLW